MSNKQQQQQHNNKQKDKNSSGGGSKKSKPVEDDSKRDQKLQAILLADSFEKTFRPVTWEGPKVLLPLVNVPMLEYTIEFLAQSGVEEADILQAYISKSKWPATISVRCIASSSCLSAGDALRELDTMGVIGSEPFVLISGDVISNMDLKKAIAFHKEKRKADSTCIMTVVLKQIHNMTGAKQIMDNLVVGMDKNTSQLILFEDSYVKNGADIALEIIAEHPALTLRTDLLDCHIDICSPELMLQFSDNFDYQDIRRDFIQNEAVNWELGMHIYGYTLSKEYAARVHDPRTYHCISRDIVTRWVYPIVPDAQLQLGSSYCLQKHCNYRETSVKVSRSAHIGENVVLGMGTVVAEQASVHKTVVGRHCEIGAGAVVAESHLWEGCIIGAGVKISHAILCSGVVVKEAAVIGRGCVLSYGVVIGAGVVVPEFSRISLRKSVENQQAMTSGYDTSVVGVDGKGFLWVCTGDDLEPVDEFDSDGQDIHQLSPGQVLRAHSMGCVELEEAIRSMWSVLPVAHEDEDSDLEGEDLEFGSGGCYDDDDDEMGAIQDEVSGSGKKSASEGAVASSRGNANFSGFVTEMVVTAQAEGHPADNVLLEIKGCKFSENTSFADCVRAVVPALLATAAGTSQILLQSTQAASAATSQPPPPPAAAAVVPALTSLQLVTALQAMFKAGGFGFIILRALVQEEGDQIAAIEAVEQCVLLPYHQSSLCKIFRLILQMLYEAELLSESGLLRWIKLRSSAGNATAGVNQLYEHPQVQAFVTWIQEEDDDDEESEDGENDEDSD